MNLAAAVQGADLRPAKKQLKLPVRIYCYNSEHVSEVNSSLIYYYILIYTSSFIPLCQTAETE